MRHLRLRQLLEFQGYTGKDKREAVAFEHDNWKEDGESLPTIKEVRKMHVTLGTWDKLTYWNRYNTVDGIENFVVNYRKGFSFCPRANYKHRLKVYRWEEHERRTEEFFDSMGV